MSKKLPIRKSLRSENASDSETTLVKIPKKSRSKATERSFRGRKKGCYWCFPSRGGNMNGKISLHDKTTNKRLTQNAKTSDCRFVAYNSWIVSVARSKMIGGGVQ